ncbi:MAG: sigma-54-dependent Fis family transcriptional regulator [Polyangiaceae bacterium]|nr:sigma-54-dependent Fis family transcriptional regulator [Polyangiaceae bacterium]MCW5790615.1 sigma-54-dependent Fis family transcriptional regulator [Polyangiaceae bacterium]
MISIPSPSQRPPALIGTSPPTLRLQEQVLHASRTHSHLLIVGATGTAKSSVAHAVWAGRGGSEPQALLSCLACDPSQHEQQLFGDGEDPGLVEAARGGVLHITHVDQLSLAAQRRLAAALPSLDLQLIASSRRAPEEAGGKAFAPELVARFGAPVELAPLSERSQDLPALIALYIAELAVAARGPMRLHPDAMAALTAYPWPGNVRELASVIQHALLCTEGPEIQLRDLPAAIQGARPQSEEPEVLDLRVLEQRAIQRALQRTGGCMAQAARLLGIGRATIYRKLAANPNIGELGN